MAADCSKCSSLSPNWDKAMMTGEFTNHVLIVGRWDLNIIAVGLALTNIAKPEKSAYYFHGEDNILASFIKLAFFFKKLFHSIVKGDATISHFSEKTDGLYFHECIFIFNFF